MKNLIRNIAVATALIATPLVSQAQEKIQQTKQQTTQSLAMNMDKPASTAKSTTTNSEIAGTTAESVLSSIGVKGLNEDQMKLWESLRVKLWHNFQPYTQEFLEQNKVSFQGEEGIQKFVALIDGIRSSLTDKSRINAEGKNRWELYMEGKNDDRINGVLFVYEWYQNWFIVYGKKKGQEYDARGAEADARGAEADARGAEADARGAEADARGAEAEKIGIQSFVRVYQAYLGNPNAQWLKTLNEMLRKMQQGNRDTNSIKDKVQKVNDDISKHPDWVK